MDLGTGLTALGASALLTKLLGPTCDYLGENLKVGTQKATANVNRIFSNAIKKLGSKIEEPGGIPPKVLKAVLTDGAFCDDPLAAEYFGGVLASARTENSRDDRATTYLSLISRLSTYQIRAHYIFYHAIKIALKNRSLSAVIHQQNLELYISESLFNKAMDFSETENIDAITSHTFTGLASEGVIGGKYVIGDLEYIKVYARTPLEPTQLKMRDNLYKVTEGGIISQPSMLGIALFCWAHGMPDLLYYDYIKPELEFPIIEGIELPADALFAD